MTDPTEQIRREITQEINAVEGSREWVEGQYGQVWDTKELQQEFQVTGFGAPFVAVTRKSDGAKGSMYFQHSPRFYFNFEVA